ncbi:MAG TPA: hypothetical protein VIV61_15065, partial [Candidatus Ozemobacteraceae bacterium]
MSPHSPGPRYSRRLWLIPLLLGVFPPLLLIALGLSTLQAEREARIAAVKARLDAAMGPVAGSLDPYTWAERRLKRLAGRLVSGGEGAASARRELITRAASLGIETYLFDAAAAPVVSPGTPLRARFVMQKLWFLLASPPTPERFLEERRLIKTFCAALGSDFRVSDLRRREGMALSFRVRRQDGYILWLRRSPGDAGDRSGCLLVLWKGPDQKSLIRHAARASRGRAKGRS